VTEPIRYETLDPKREAEALALVRAVFDRDVAPGFSEEGRATFHEFINLFAFSRRPGESFDLAAIADGRIVGVIEVIDGHHIALLFVAPDRQGRGIGWELVRRAALRCLRSGQPPARLTVNASPDAVAAYRRMGFSPLEDERERDGIRFVPMFLPLFGLDAP